MFYPIEDGAADGAAIKAELQAALDNLRIVIQSEIEEAVQKERAFTQDARNGHIVVKAQLKAAQDLKSFCTNPSLSLLKGRIGARVCGRRGVRPYSKTIFDHLLSLVAAMTI